MKAYYVKNVYDGESLICGIADTPNKSKMIAHNYFSQYDGGEYIDLRATICRNGNIEGLKNNIIVKELDGLKRGIYGSISNENCPVCKTEDTKLYYDNGFYCDNCEKTDNGED